MKLLLRLVITIILIIAIGLRVNNLSGMHNLQADEESWVVSGHLLMRDGIPKSWTIFWSKYQDAHYEQLNGKPYLVAEPYLDHPPLFSVFIGAWTLITRTSENLLSNWLVLRLPMIVISTITILVTAYLIKKLYGTEQALFTLLAFSFMPSHILTSKLIMAEHAMALLLVTALLFLVFFFQSTNQTHKKIYTSLLAITSFMAILIKISGIIVPLILITLLLQNNERKTALCIGLATVLAIASFILFGCYYDANMFFTILTAHSLRPQTFWYFFTLFEKPNIGYLQIHDPLPIVGSIGSLVLAFRNHVENKKVKPQQFITVMWIFLAIILVAVAPIELYGWYKFLLFPLIAIGIGRIWHEFYHGQVGWIALLLPALLVLMENVFLGIVVFDALRRILILGLFGVGLYYLIKKKSSLHRFYPHFAGVIIAATVFFAATWSLIISTEPMALIR